MSCLIRAGRLFIFAGIFFCCVFSVYAQTPGERETRRLTPGEAVDMAIRNNLHLEMARIGLDIQRRAAGHAWNRFLPTVGVTGTMSRANWPNTTPGMTIPLPGGLPPIVVPSTALPQWNVMGAFSAELVISFALIEGIKALQHDYAAGAITFERARLQMEQAVRKMYNNILLLEANVALLEESYLNTRRQAEMAEASFRAGLAPRLVSLQAQVAVENLRPAVNDLENTLTSLKGNFALILGLPFDTPLELAPISFEVSQIPGDVADLISRAASGKPDIRELQANIRTLQTQRKALRMQNYTPFLRFGWTVSSMFDPMLDPFQESWSNRDNWSGGGNFSFTLGLNFNGLLPFTTEGQRIRDMNAALQIQNIMLAQTIRDTELEIFTKINSLEKIRTTVEVQQATVNLAEESYRLTEEAFRAGLQDFQVVQNAALALDQAKLRLLSEQFNFLNDLIDLEYSIGVPFGTLSGSMQ